MNFKLGWVNLSQVEPGRLEKYGLRASSAFEFKLRGSYNDGGLERGHGCSINFNLRFNIACLPPGQQPTLPLTVPHNERQSTPGASSSAFSQYNNVSIHLYCLSCS